MVTYHISFHTCRLDYQSFKYMIKPFCLFEYCSVSFKYRTASKLRIETMRLTSPHTGTRSVGLDMLCDTTYVLSVYVCPILCSPEHMLLDMNEVLNLAT